LVIPAALPHRLLNIVSIGRFRIQIKAEQPHRAITT
jgi:hypothetical protein